MSLSGNVAALATRIAQEIKAIKDYVDALGATAPTANTLVRRDEFGNIQAGSVYAWQAFDGSGAQSGEVSAYTRKDYVDGNFARVVKESGGTYPARPTGATMVIWQGTTDPGAASLNGDMWVQV